MWSGENVNRVGGSVVSLSRCWLRCGMLRSLAEESVSDGRGIRGGSDESSWAGRYGVWWKRLLWGNEAWGRGWDIEAVELGEEERRMELI